MTNILLKCMLVVLATTAVHAGPLVPRDKMKYCMRQPLFSDSRSGDTRHVVTGSTSDRLQADDILVRVESFTGFERMISCRVKCFLQKLAHFKNHMMKALPLPLELASPPGRSGVSDQLLDDMPPSVVNVVAIDLDSGLVSVELAFSGLLLGYKPRQMPITLHTPAERWRVTSHIVIRREPGGATHLHAKDVAVKIMMAEKPDVVGTMANGNYRPAFDMINTILGAKFNKMLNKADHHHLDTLSGCIKDRINKVLHMIDITMFQPDLIRKLTKMEGALDSGVRTIKKVKEAAAI